MVPLLATYGLRGIEVVRLHLRAIDWRNQKLRIRRRKAGNSTVYPLASPARTSSAARLSKPAAELIEIALNSVVGRDAARERR
jgi:integrase